jgi:hypothetical protein
MDQRNYQCSPDLQFVNIAMIMHREWAHDMHSRVQDKIWIWVTNTQHEPRYTAACPRLENAAHQARTLLIPTTDDGIHHMPALL